MGDTYLICEGSHGSTDEQVLNQIIAQHFGLAVLVEGAGGESSLRSVRSWVEDQSRRHAGGRPTTVAFAVQDRGYRSIEDADESWKKPNARVFIWRRHEIENYLLEPRVVFAAFEHISTSVEAPWVDKLPTTEADVVAILRNLAVSLLEHHAAILTLEQLEGEKREHCMRGFGYPALIDALPAPGARQAWVDVVMETIHKVTEGCRTVASLDYSRAAVERRFRTCLCEISSDEYMAARLHLRDLKGKKLLSELLRHIRTEIGASTISTDDFRSELVNALARTYTPGLFDPDDFRILADRIRASH